MGGGRVKYKKNIRAREAFFFRLSQKKKKKKTLIAGQANLDLSDVANLG